MKKKKDENITEEKKSPFEEALSLIEKKHGAGAIMRLGDKPKIVSVIPTGSICLDDALGVGGLPTGRIVEIYGQESAGKTTMALSVVAECQKAGGKCVFIDVEHSLDMHYCQQIGIDVDNLFLSQPEYGEQALDIVDVLVRSGKVNCIVVDSVSGLVPKVELEGEMGQQFMGLQSRLMSQAMRKLAAIVSKYECCLIFINQIRDKIGVMWGPKTTTSGGNALKFYASVRLDVKKMDQIKDGDDIIGNRVKVIVKKNKMAPPFKEAEFDLIFGEGIDKYGEIIDLGVEKEIIDKSGAWYAFGETRLGCGKENAREFLKEHKDVFEAIYKKIKEPEIENE